MTDKICLEMPGPHSLSAKKPPQNTFCVAFHILVWVKFETKFGGQVDRMKSQPMGDKPSLKAAWSYHVT